jgi:hypothetical protein
LGNLDGFSAHLRSKELFGSLGVIDRRSGLFLLPLTLFVSCVDIAKFRSSRS